MSTREARALPCPAGRIGDLLREWRTARRMSQLDLACVAEVSPRHLSYVENGRAQPSREMVGRLSDALDVPLRERNTLLYAAGYAPQYRETGLAAPEMMNARRALELILRQQEPYPAFVFDRGWDLVMRNQGSTRFFGYLRGKPQAHSNIMRSVFHPDGLRPMVANWEEVAGNLIRRLHNEVAATPSDDRARVLLAEILAYPDVPPRWRTRELGAPSMPLLPTVYRKDDREFRLFSTVTTFGTPQDITLDELRIESFFPADEATAIAYNELFGS